MKKANLFIILATLLLIAVFLATFLNQEKTSEMNNVQTQNTHVLEKVLTHPFPYTWGEMQPMSIENETYGINTLESKETALHRITFDNMSNAHILFAPSNHKFGGEPEYNMGTVNVVFNDIHSACTNLGKNGYNDSNQLIYSLDRIDGCISNNDRIDFYAIGKEAYLSENEYYNTTRFSKYTLIATGDTTYPVIVAYVNIPKINDIHLQPEGYYKGYDRETEQKEIGEAMENLKNGTNLPPEATAALEEFNTAINELVQRFN